MPSENSAPETAVATSHVCELHGSYDIPRIDETSPLARLPKWLRTRCPACAAERQANQAAEEARKAEEARLRRIKWLVDDSGVRGRYLDQTLDTFDAEIEGQRRAIQACRNYVDEVVGASDVALFMLGGPGTGKTHLSCAMVQAVIERTLEPAYIVTVSALVREIRDSWRASRSRSDSDTEADILHRYGTARLLVLDDVGATFGGESEQKHLLDLIDIRYTHRRPTVIVSNLSQPELRVVLGERTFDRLREQGRKLVFDWESYRGKHRVR